MIRLPTPCTDPSTDFPGYTCDRASCARNQYIREPCLAVAAHCLSLTIHCLSAVGSAFRGGSTAPIAALSAGRLLTNAVATLPFTAVHRGAAVG